MVTSSRRAGYRLQGAVPGSCAEGVRAVTLPQPSPGAPRGSRRTVLILGQEGGTQLGPRAQRPVAPECKAWSCVGEAISSRAQPRVLGPASVALGGSWSAPALYAPPSQAGTVLCPHWAQCVNHRKVLPDTIHLQADCWIRVASPHLKVPGTTPYPLPPPTENPGWHPAHPASVAPGTQGPGFPDRCSQEFYELDNIQANKHA